MNLSDIRELHYIAPIVNVPSILQHGLLSHHKAAKLPHRSVAMEEIQDRRRVKRIPTAGPLHDYVNLYFDAHNPMLSKCRRHNDSICVLRVEATVLELPEVIVTDRNAAAEWARFYRVVEGLRALERSLYLPSIGRTPRTSLTNAAAKQLNAQKSWFRLQSLPSCCLGPTWPMSEPCEPIRM